MFDGQQGERQGVVDRLGDMEPVVAECFDPLRVGDDLGQASGEGPCRRTPSRRIDRARTTVRSRARTVGALRPPTGDDGGSLGRQPVLVEALGHPLPRFA